MTDLRILWQREEWQLAAGRIARCRLFALGKLQA